MNVFFFKNVGGETFFSFPGASLLLRRVASYFDPFRFKGPRWRLSKKNEI